MTEMVYLLALMVMTAITLAMVVLTQIFVANQNAYVIRQLEYNVNQTQIANLADRAHSDNLTRFLINQTNKANIEDRAHSDMLTRLIIQNNTNGRANNTDVILENITSLINKHFDTLRAQLDRNAGIGVRLHSDIEQIYHLLLNKTNQTGHMIDIVPGFGH